MGSLPLALPKISLGYSIQNNSDNGDIISSFVAGSGGDIIDFSTNIAQVGTNDPTNTFDSDTTIDDTTAFIVSGTDVLQGSSATLTEALNGITAGTFDGGGGTIDKIYIGWDNGSDTYIGLVTSDGNNDGFVGDSLTLICTLSGLSDCTTLTASNFLDFS